MNPEKLAEAKKLFNLTKKGVKKIKNIEIVICPPFVYLPVLKANGAQDCFWQDKGAFTGEISPAMLKNLGCCYVIIGHSERRRCQKETDETINKKIKAALSVGLKVILCIDRVSQLEKDLKGIKTKDLIVAYEPLFAIGTGKACSVAKAKDMRIAIEKKMKKKIPVLYGGSVNSHNALDYLKKGGFRGLLVGGASLNSKEFVKIAENLSYN